MTVLRRYTSCTDFPGFERELRQQRAGSKIELVPDFNYVCVSCVESDIHKGGVCHMDLCSWYKCYQVLPVVLGIRSTNPETTPKISRTPTSSGSLELHRFQCSQSQAPYLRELAATVGGVRTVYSVFTQSYALLQCESPGTEVRKRRTYECCCIYVICIAS
jgi:hypothetical protein